MVSGPPRLSEKVVAPWKGGDGAARGRMLILQTSKWRASGEAAVHEGVCVEGALHTVPAPPCSPVRLEGEERGRRQPGGEQPPTALRSVI